MMAALIAVLILITNLYYLLIEEQNVLGVSRRGWWWILMEAFLEDFQEKGPEWQKFWPVAERGGGSRHFSISEIHRLKGREMWKPLAGWRTSHCPARRAGNWGVKDVTEGEPLGFVCSVMSDCLRPYGLQPTRLLYPGDFLGEDPRIGCHFLLQGIFPTQGSTPVSLALGSGFFTTEPPGKPIWPTTQVKW